MVEGSGLENHRSRKASLGSNPSLSANSLKGRKPTTISSTVGFKNSRMASEPLNATQGARTRDRRAASTHRSKNGIQDDPQLFADVLGEVSRHEIVMSSFFDYLRTIAPAEK